MSILSLLAPARVIQLADGGSKKRTLEIASDLIAQTQAELTASRVFTGLINREKLGSTGIGEGVAIPHCRLAGVSAAIGALLKLSGPVDFDAIDNQPVDLLFFLLVPEDACDEHLATLGTLAEVFSQSSAREQLRAAQTDEQLLNAATQLFQS